MIKVKNSKTTKLAKNKNSIQHLRITELNQHKQTRDDLQQMKTYCEGLD